MQKNYTHPLTLLATSFSTLLLSCAGDPIAPGKDGKDAPPLLTRSSATEASDDCPSGGTRLEIGPDRNGNETLDESEVSEVLSLCDGTSGENGKNGANGKDGTDGRSGSLIRVTNLESPPVAISSRRVWMTATATKPHSMVCSETAKLTRPPTFVTASTASQSSRL